MNLEELIAQYREDALDQEDPPFCSDELLTKYANEGQVEACRRGQLVRDSISPITRIDFAANAEYVTLDPKIINLVRSKVDGHDADVISAADMDCAMPCWQADQSRSRPMRLVSGLSAGALFLWPRPKDAGTLALTVDRMPLKAMANDFDKPEIRVELHRGLVDWMLYRAFSRSDGDLADPQKAATSYAAFEREFGGKASGRNQQWVRDGNRGSADPIA